STSMASEDHANLPGRLIVNWLFIFHHDSISSIVDVLPKIVIADECLDLLFEVETVTCLVSVILMKKVVFVFTSIFGIGLQFVRPVEETL
ncbi:hypothetical protein PJI17_31945, partial [Mycobacterium kansasii]